MRPKPLRAARRHRTAASQLAGSQSTHLPRRHEFDVLLNKLTPFLGTVTADELADIPAAAEALARTPRGARGLFHPHPPQPVEVVVARDGREIVGALLLRRKWMERIFDESQRNDAHSVDSASEKISALGDWLNGFGRLLGSWLARELALANAQCYMQEPSDCLDMLEQYAEHRPNEFEELWSLPLTQYFLRYVKNGTPVERRRLRSLEERRLTDARGRPHINPEDSKDVVIATQVEVAETRLQPGWNYVRANQRDGRGQNREVLVGMGYQADEVTVLVEGRHRRLHGAAVSLVARHSGRQVESISAQASRGARK